MKTPNRPQIAIIVAVDEQNAIGREGGLLCHLPNDLKHFKAITSGHTVIMGRKTYESLPNGALPNRKNIVITSDKAGNYPNCLVVRSIDEALAHCQDEDKVFIIGGGQLYHSTLNLADELYLTRIHHTFKDADTFFPPIDFEKWRSIHKVTFNRDERHKHDYSFLNYVKKIM